MPSIIKFYTMYKIPQQLSQHLTSIYSQETDLCSPRDESAVHLATWGGNSQNEGHSFETLTQIAKIWAIS